MNTKRVEELKRNLGPKNTAELLEIWNMNDRKSYTDEAFEVIRLILTERGVAIPKQSMYVPVEDQSLNKQVSSIQQPTSTRFKVALAFLIIGALLLLAAFGCIVICAGSDIEDCYDQLTFGLIGVPVGFAFLLVGGFLRSRVRLRSLIKWVVITLFVLLVGVLIWFLLSIYHI